MLLYLKLKISVFVVNNILTGRTKRPGTFVGIPLSGYVGHYPADGTWPFATGLV
jgi:hypothetical protein